MEKSTAIHEALALLRHQLGDEAFDVVDHWTADLDAIGIASREDHRVLVYIAAYGDTFYVELELPPVPASDLPYKFAGQHKSGTSNQLVDLVRKHLGRS